MYHGRQADDDVSHDVGQHNVISAAQRPPHGLVAQHVAHLYGVYVLADAVESGVFIGHIQAFVVNIHRHGGICPQFQGGNGQNAAAAAQIQHLFAAPDRLLQRRQAQLGGGVTAGAEGQARVQDQGDPAAAVGLFPLGDDQQPLSDLHGLVVLLPVVFPVRVLEVFQGQQQRAAVAPALLQGLQGDADLAHFGEALLVRGEIKGDPGRTLHFLLQVLVHIVPVLVVVFQEVLKFSLVVNDHAVDAQGGEHRLHRLQPGMVGLNVQL